jgi:hypothetical protein
MPYVILIEEESKEDQWEPTEIIPLKDGIHTVGNDETNIPIEIVGTSATIRIDKAKGRLDKIWCLQLGEDVRISEVTEPDLITVDSLTLHVNPPYPGGESDDIIEVWLQRKRYFLMWRDS